jgi:hypothetical protein
MVSALSIVNRNGGGDQEVEKGYYEGKGEKQLKGVD